MFFLEHEPFLPLHLSLPPPSTHHTLPHGSEFSRWIECVHTILLPASFDLSKVLKFIGTHPKKKKKRWLEGLGSGHTREQTPNFHYRQGLRLCKFDFRPPSKFFVEVCLYHLSPSIVFVCNSGCIDRLPEGQSGLGEVLFSWKGVCCQSEF